MSKMPLLQKMPMVGDYFPLPKCHGIQWVCHYHIMSFILLSGPRSHTRNITKQDLGSKTTAHTSKPSQPHRHA